MDFDMKTLSPDAQNQIIKQVVELENEQRKQVFVARYCAEWKLYVAGNKLATQYLNATSKQLKKVGGRYDSEHWFLELQREYPDPNQPPEFRDD
jgi:hypothetical protein